MHNLGTPSHAGLSEQEGARSLRLRPVGAVVGGRGGFKQENTECQKSSVLLLCPSGSPPPLPPIIDRCESPPFCGTVCI